MCLKMDGASFRSNQLNRDKKKEIGFGLGPFVFVFSVVDERCAGKGIELVLDLGLFRFYNLFLNLGSREVEILVG